MDIKHIKLFDKVMKELSKTRSVYGVIKRGPKKGTVNKVDKKYTPEYLKQYFKDYYQRNKEKYKDRNSYIKKNRDLGILE